MFTALLVTPDNTCAEVTVDNYKQIQQLVGGPFDIARTEVRGDDVSIYVHDEGLIIGLPTNTIATVLRQMPYVYLPLEERHRMPPLVGPALIGGGVDAEGNSLSISDHTRDAVESIMQAITKIAAVMAEANHD